MSSSVPTPKKTTSSHGRHRRIEGWPLVFTVLVTVSILVGTVVEFAPIFLARGATTPMATLTPFTPLELAGRDLYIREGCNNCHSQMVRPFQDEVQRYGPPGTAAETAYETPFLWGSKRTGPDLSRVGGKYPHLWHVRHMEEPVSTSPRSIMPPYPWLLTRRLDLDDLPRRVRAHQTLGIPYSDADVAGAVDAARTQAQAIAQEVASQGGPADLADREIVAMVAFLQRLGVDARANAANAPTTALVR